jgi:sec-independent protein translocase protein TatC
MTITCRTAMMNSSSSSQHHHRHHHQKNHQKNNHHRIIMNSSSSSSSSSSSIVGVTTKQRTQRRRTMRNCHQFMIATRRRRNDGSTDRNNNNNNNIFALKVFANDEEDEEKDVIEEDDERVVEIENDVVVDNNNNNNFKTSITDDPNFLKGLGYVNNNNNNNNNKEEEDLAKATMTRTQTSRSFSLLQPPNEQVQKETVRSFLYPSEEELPDDIEMSIWEHLEELRDRALISSGAVAAGVLLCFCFAKDLVIFLEKPVSDMGVRFLQLGPGEYFFTTVKVAGYTGILLAAPVVLYEIIAYVLPGLTKQERKTLGPIVLGSSVLFYVGIYFAYLVLTPAALKFFVGYADGAVESLWSIDQYFEFVLVLLFSTGLSFQVPVIQLLLGQTGIVSSKQMLSAWKFVIVGSVVAAAVLTPSTDPFTQMLLAVPLMSLYFGGAFVVSLVEKERKEDKESTALDAGGRRGGGGGN